MKKLLVVCAVLFAVTSIAEAQRFDVVNRIPLEFDDNIEERQLSVDVAAVIGDDSTLFGVAAAHPYSADLDLSAGLAFLELDDGDVDGPSIFGSALFDLDFGLPFPTAVLTKLAYAQLEGDAEGRSLDADILEFTVLAVAAGDTSIADLAWDFRVGVAFADSDGDAGPDSELEPQIGAGASYAISKVMSAWAAVDHVDDTFISLGLRHDF